MPDDVWHDAAAAFDDKTLADLLLAIVTINAWNRLAIATRYAAGQFQPAGGTAAVRPVIAQR